MFGFVTIIQTMCRNRHFAMWMLAACYCGTMGLRCRENQFACADGTKCINGSSFCDRRLDCRDHSDERPSKTFSKYDINTTLCRGKSGYICSVRNQHLSNMSLFCDADWQCKEDEFLCRDGSRCINGSQICDGVVLDCSDNSDDSRRRRSVTYDATANFYRGPSGRICAIPDDWLAYKEQQCRLRSDDCQCRKHNEEYFFSDGCFRCLSLPSFVLSTSQVCNGIVDCPDLSDECVCPFNNRLQICKNVILDRELPGPQPYVRCSSNLTVQVSSNVVCDKSKDCPNGEDEAGCNRNGTTEAVPKQRMECENATECDSNWKCLEYRDNECRCPNNITRCSAQTHKVLQSCKETFGILAFSRLCDGVSDCAYSIDEWNCYSMRFYCTEKQMPNIPLDKRCDRHDDCANGEDEKGCSHYLCNDNGTVKYLPQDYVCDGFQDCDSGRDECTCVNSIFSDDKSMIKSKLVLVIVSIMSISAVIGCSAVVAMTTRGLLRPAKRGSSGHAKLIKIQILSLSVSDFLVTIYTLVICIKASQFDKNYCKVDREWRSSQVCSTLGALLVIGSEQSVLTMVWIAISRLLSVMRPFSHPSVRKAVLVLVATWTLSIVIGVIPLVPSFEDRFVKSALFNRNEMFKMIYVNETDYLTNWLSLMRNGTVYDLGHRDTNWNKLRKLAAAVNPNFTVAYEYGYYSSHTVCLPTLFPDRSQDHAWGYTLMLLVVNFLAFATMLILYLVLYRRASKENTVHRASSAREKRQQQNVKMQRKLTRIVVSDFLCWIPICVMGFLQIIGIPIPKDAYLPSGLFIIPINSTLNPILYSDIPDMVIRKLKEATGCITRSARFGSKQSDPSTEGECLSTAV